MSPDAKPRKIVAIMELTEAQVAEALGAFSFFGLTLLGDARGVQRFLDDVLKMPQEERERHADVLLSVSESFWALARSIDPEGTAPFDIRLKGASE